MARIGSRAWGIAAYLIAAVSVGTMLSHGWVPIDEGTIVLSARLVRAGYLPHLDFAYPYTGALAWWNAWATRVLGDTSLAPRYALFAAFLFWLPAVWSLARRYVPAPGAAAVVLLAAWWSLLIYPAAMPTWYLLFLTTWMLVALARWSERGAGPRWLLLAGAAAGVAIVVKQTGVLTLVGAGFAVLALHQDRERSAPDSAGVLSRHPDRFVVLLLCIALVVPAALVVRRGPLAGEGPLVALPLAAAIIALVARERRLHSDVTRSRRALLGSWGTLIAGALIAPGLLVAFYMKHGGIRALADGAIGGALRTAATIESPMPPALTIFAYAIPLVAAAAVAFKARSARVIADVVLAGIVAVAAGLAAMYFTSAYLSVWYFAMLVLPAAVLGAAWMSARRSVNANDGLVLGIAASAALLAANQVPYAAPNYFGYVAPLAFLVGIVVMTRAGFGRAAMIPAAVLLLFGGWYHRIGGVGTVGIGPIWWDDAHRLPGAHGGLLVTGPDSAAHARLMTLIGGHGGAEAFVAGPELGELYVLAGTRRLVAQSYLLSPDATADSLTLAAAIDTTRIRSVAINTVPHFLPAVSPAARAWIATRYPNAERVGDVEFRWR